jgi:hypothetical protein
MILRPSASRLKNVAAAALAACLSLSATALAADPGPDEVTLKNGGSIRGTVVSSEPGTSVKILEAGQSQPRVIPWSQVSDVEKGKYAPSAATQPGSAGPGYGTKPPPPPADDAAPPEPKMGTTGVVKLHIDSPVPVTLIEQRSGIIGTYNGYGLVLTASRKTCSSPCDSVIDARRGVFLIDGQFPVPGSFDLSEMKGDVTMHVDPGSKGMRAGGVVAMVLGVTAAVTGGVLLPLALGTSTTDLNTSVTVSTPNRPLQNAGIGLLAGGLAALGGGIALFVTGATHVKIEPSGAASGSGASARVTPRYWLGEF